MGLVPQMNAAVNTDTVEHQQTTVELDVKEELVPEILLLKTLHLKILHLKILLLKITVVEKFLVNMEIVMQENAAVNMDTVEHLQITVELDVEQELVPVEVETQVIHQIKECSVQTVEETVLVTNVAVNTVGVELVQDSVTQGLDLKMIAHLDLLEADYQQVL